MQKKPTSVLRDPTVDPVYLAADVVASLIQPLPAGTAYFIRCRAANDDDRAPGPVQRQPGPRGPALRLPSQVGVASGRAGDGAGQVLLG